MCASKAALTGPTWAAAFAFVADRDEFLLDGIAVAIGQRVGRFDRHRASPDSRAHHRRVEAATFFVGPYNRFDRMLCLHVMIVQGLDDFETGQHAIDTVELATGRLRVEVTARDDRRERIVFALASRENIANGIDANSQPASRHQRLKSSRPALSSSVSACRLQPPAGVAPISPMAINRDQRRSPSILSLDLSLVWSPGARG